MSGRHEVRRIHIDPSVGDDMEMLEDLIAAAYGGVGPEGHDQRGARVGA